MGGVIVIIKKMSFLSNLQGACVENVHAVFLYLVIDDIGDIGDIKYIHVYVSLFFVCWHWAFLQLFNPQVLIADGLFAIWY